MKYEWYFRTLRFLVVFPYSLIYYFFPEMKDIVITNKYMCLMAFENEKRSNIFKNSVQREGH